MCKQIWNLFFDCYQIKMMCKEYYLLNIFKWYVNVWKIASWWKSHNVNYDSQNLKKYFLIYKYNIPYCMTLHDCNVATFKCFSVSILKTIHANHIFQYIHNVHILYILSILIIFQKNYHNLSSKYFLKFVHNAIWHKGIDLGSFHNF